MKKWHSLVLLVLLALGHFQTALAQDNCATGADNPDQSAQLLGQVILYSGNCDADNERIITTGDLLRWQACWILSTTGAVDVYVSLDGTNYATAALSLIDMTSTSFTRVAATTQGSPAAFEIGGVRRIRVLASGGAATVTVACFQNR